ncbi:hypothetical protein [Kitasatospora fiedleri]|uniref:hypothetical protein n=1 Tax=Kitasatospora fiedleri TaxID=2991545 RepID=UPI00249AEFC7|nr:hypothetical protein [Kitasatospora fiedleri]
MSTREFMVLLGGLSEQARWPRAYADTPLVTSSPADIAAALGSYYGDADPPPGGDPPEQ